MVPQSIDPLHNEPQLSRQICPIQVPALQSQAVHAVDVVIVVDVDVDVVVDAVVVDVVVQTSVPSQGSPQFASKH